LQVIHELTGAAARLSVRGPQRAIVIRLACRAGRRWPRARVARSLAYHLREALARDGRRVAAELPSGSEIVLDPSDRYHAQILFFGELEAETTAFFRRVARRGWTVLDVGANSGYFSLLARDLGGDGAVVRSFEPNPEVVELLAETMRRNGSGIGVEPKACGAEAGELPLHLGADCRNTGLATLSPGAAKGDSTISVPVVALDDYCAEEGLAPDLVKIDVEGFEDQVVAGMRTLLRNRVPRHVICEMSSAPGSPAPAKVIAELEGFGYSAHHIRADGTLGPLGEVSFENVCFARSRP